MSAARRLPARPSLDSLRKQAKRLARAVAAGDRDAIARVHAQLPRAKLPLSNRDAQLGIAREYGFAGWPALTAEVHERVGSGLDWAASQARVAIHDEDHERLRALLAEYPALVSWRGERDQMLLDSTTSYAMDCMDPERERTYTRPVAAEMLIDAGASVETKTWMHVIRTGASGMLHLFSRKQALPRTLPVLAALGDAAAIRAQLEETRERGETDASFDEQRMIGRALPACHQKDREGFIAALLERDPALPHVMPPPPSSHIVQALSHGNAHLVPLLTRIWPLPNDMPHAAGVGDEEAVARWFDASGRPALGSLAHHYPHNDPQFSRADLHWGPPTPQQVLDIALAWAVLNRHFEIATFLLEGGANIDTDWGTHEPASILHEAAIQGNEDAVRFLIAHGADLTMTDYRYRSTAEGWARYGSHDERMAELLAAAALTKGRRKFRHGTTAVHCRTGSVERHCAYAATSLRHRRHGIGVEPGGTSAQAGSEYSGSGQGGIRMRTRLGQELGGARALSAFGARRGTPSVGVFPRHASGLDGARGRANRASQ